MHHIPNVRATPIKLLEEKLGVNLHDFSLGIDMTTKKKICKLDFTNIRNSCFK